MIKKALVACAVMATMGAQAQFVTLLNEGFDTNTTTLASKGWVFTNNSSPIGTATSGWFQGGTVFSGQSGGLGSYLGSAYYAASEAGGATLAAWLISPSFSTYAAGNVSFYARADIAAGYSDGIRYGLSTSGSSAVSSFALSPTSVLGSGWAQYTLSFAGTGTNSTARFAIEYLGNADTSNYIGVDSVLISAIPEPATYALMGLGLIGVAWGRRAARTTNAA